jgi:PKD repeat protein
VIAAPGQPGAISGNTSVCKTNTSVGYSISSVTGATSYTWAISGGATFVGGSTGSSVTVRYTTATSSTATLTVMANNACSSSTIRSLSIAVNLNCRVTGDQSVTENTNAETGISSEISAYPNPTSEKLNIAFNAAADQKYSFKLLDVIGKIIIEESYSAREGENVKQLDLRKVSKGIYFVMVTKEGEQPKSIRIVVQ